MANTEIVAVNPSEFGPRWSKFSQRHDGWLAEGLGEGNIVYRVPRPILPGLQLLLGLTREEADAEGDLDDLCNVFHAIGVSQDRPITYRWLQPRIAPPSDKTLASMSMLGWSDAQILQARELCRKTDDVAHRLQGVAGRLISCPSFLEGRDRLLSMWLRLPDEQRPELPLLRSPEFAKLPPDSERISVSRRLKEVVRQFDAFCDEWRLQGMATWDLPIPLGPQWPVLRQQPERGHPGALELDTPWHFPLREDDGLGSLPRQEHEREATERGIADALRWQVYAHLLELDHWERVLRGRYPQRTKPKGFVTQMEGILSDLLLLDVERVRKLRKVLAALRSGRRSSLTGWR